MEHTTHTHDVYGLAKPTLRGVVHGWAVVPFAIAGAWLVSAAPSGAARAGTLVYALAVTGMLLASTCYHRLRVSPRTRTWLRRLDHSMIGVTIAGTYTPVVLLAVTGLVRAGLLAVLWAGAVGSMVLAMAKPDAPRWVRSGAYVLLGMSGVAVTPELLHRGGGAAFGLVLAGAGLYITGAVVYARRRPDPVPGVYGFHELFHTFVVGAVAAQYAGIWTLVQRAT